MRADDLTVEVRDVELGRIGQILPKDLLMKAKIRWCGVGEWEVTLPGNHPMVTPLRTPGSGLLVTWTNPDDFSPQVLFSGPTVHPSRKRGIENPDGTLTFTGVTDDVLLDDSLAYPDPATVNVSAQTKANDVQTGSTEALMRHYVDANIGPSAPSGRKRGMLQYVELEGANADRGVPTTQRSPRFANLLETLQSLAVEAPLGFRMVQVDDNIQFQIREVTDLRGTIRLDVNAGTLIAEETSQQGPTVTKPIVAGQGEGTDRQIIERTNAQAIADETAWGRAIERFYDRRDTDDVLELEAKGDEELALGAGGTSAKVIPADDSTMRYMIDWAVGDWINVVVNDLEEETIITEAVLVFDKDKSAVGVGLGDVTSFDPRDVQSRKQANLDSRIGYLERATARLPLGTTGEPVTNWNLATDTGFYWSDNLAANKPPNSSFVVGTVWRNKMPSFERVVQEVRVPTSTNSSLTGNAQIIWVRVGSRTLPTDAWSWSNWRRTDKIMNPTSVVGGVFNYPTGRFVMDALSKSWSFNGVFTADYRVYRIYFEWYTGESNGAQFFLRAGGVDETSNNYNYQTIVAGGTGTPGATAGLSTVGGFPANSASGFNGTIEVTNPMYTAGTNTQKQLRSRWSSFAGVQVTDCNSSLGNKDTTAYDGFTLRISSQSGAGVTAASHSYIFVEGIA
jgi:hypothetical protein